MDGGAGLVLNIHLAPQQEISAVHYFTGDIDLATKAQKHFLCSV